MLKPEDAWLQAFADEPTTDSMRKKGCPKHAFLGLCHAGALTCFKQIGEANTHPNRNAQYAVLGWELIKHDHKLSLSPNMLWQRVLSDLHLPLEKRHNQQMNIVCALWQEKLLRGTAVK